MPESPQRSVPLRFDDGFRSALSSIPLVPALVAALAVPFISRDGLQPMWFIAGLCAALMAFSLIYMVWTHVVFTQTPPAEARRIGGLQHRRGPSGLSRWFGTGDTTTWTVSGAVTSLLAAVSAAVLGHGMGGVWLALLVVATAAASWASMVYAFALKYFRLDAGGERITFDIVEEPRFIDFVSMSVMISSVGAMSAGTPQTRAGLSVVRTHTFLGFAFNALVIATVVSLVSGLVAG